MPCVRCCRNRLETFPRANKHYLVCYPFDGRLAHQTLGMLLTRRLERLGARPLGFVANDYALAVWGMSDLGAMIAEGRLSLDGLFDEDMLGDDLDAWLAESSLMKRTFRTCAVIAGLIERTTGCPWYRKPTAPLAEKYLCREHSPFTRRSARALEIQVLGPYSAGI